MKRLLAAFVLTCALTMSAYAGDIDCGRTSEPPQASATLAGEISCGLTGDIDCGVKQTVVTIILSLL